MADRHRIIDVPPPDVAWVTVGPEHDLATLEPPARHLDVGERLGRGVVTLPGTSGQPALRTTVNGRRVAAIPQLLDDDPDATPTPWHPDLPEAVPDRLDDWLARLADAGVAPDRVNCPDLPAQLAASASGKVNLVLCSAVDADPLLPLQIEWAMRHPRAFREGLRLVARLTGADRTIVAVDDAEARGLSRELRHLDGRPAGGEQATAKPGPTDVGRIRVYPVPPAYPQGDPTLMAATLAGRKLAPLASPTSAGVIVLDAVAAVALGHVAMGAGCVRREPVAIRDHRQGLGVLAETWRGARLCDTLMFLGLIHRDPERDLRHKGGEDDRVVVRADDYLRDRRVPLTAIVGNGPLVFHVDAAAPAPAPEPCIRCGWCLDICPTALNPAGLLDADAAKGDRRLALAERHGAQACIGCGLCDHACPSRLPLRDVATRLRDELADD